MITHEEGYRHDLHKIALARATAVYRLQRPLREKAAKNYKGEGKRAQKAAAGASTTTATTTSSKKQKASKASSKRATGTTAPPPQTGGDDEDEELPELV